MRKSKSTTESDAVVKSFRDYISLFDGPPADRGALLQALRRELAAIILAGTDLKSFVTIDEYPDQEIDLSSSVLLERSKMLAEQLGNSDFYYELLIDPSADQHLLDPNDIAIGSGSLSSDLYEIYTDLSDGLVLFDRGDVDVAITKWLTDFDIHWGGHAARCLGRVHEMLGHRNIGS